MLVKQLSVFMENKAGRLSNLCKVLSANGISIVTMSIADTKDFGIVRIITRENKKALESLKKSGFTVSETELIGVEVKDEAGALEKILKILETNKISIEYLYSFVITTSGSARILFKVENTAFALEVLQKEKSIKLLSESIL